MTIREGFRHISVSMLDAGPSEPFKLIWNWYRETWYSLRNQNYEGTPEQIAACLECMNGTALPTPLEAITFQIRIEGLSRVALAQITRGRVGWAYCVTSQMPEMVEHEVVVPLSIVKSTLYAEYVRLQAELELMYNTLVLKLDIPPQDARYMLLHGQTTNLVCHVNYAALRGYFARRCENGLTDELNLIGRLVRHKLCEAWLNDGEDYVTGAGWSTLISKLDAMGGNKHCMNYDKVFGNTGRAPSINDKIPIEHGTVTPDWDFTRSAWYYELLELPEHLLLPGEKEMINDWKTIGYDNRLRKLHNEHA